MRSHALIHNPEPDSRLASAYAYCERIARQHYENFPVASRLLPAAMRPHIAAIYAFARRADDFADEPGLADADRLRLLDHWGRRLQGQTSEPYGAQTPAGEDLIFCALANTIREHNLPMSLFEDLLSAFRQDVVTTRYATWDGGSWRSSGDYAVSVHRHANVPTVS